MYHDVVHTTAVIDAEYKSGFELIKVIPYLTLMVEKYVRNIVRNMEKYDCIIFL